MYFLARAVSAADARGADNTRWPLDMYTTGWNMAQHSKETPRMYKLICRLLVKALVTFSIAILRFLKGHEADNGKHVHPPPPPHTHTEACAFCECRSSGRDVVKTSPLLIRFRWFLDIILPPFAEG